MSNKITKIEERKPVQVELPDGFYLGVWGGYTIEVKHYSKFYELTTEEGVRGIGIKVVVTIKGGEATFQEVKN